MWSLFGIGISLEVVAYAQHNDKPTYEKLAEQEKHIDSSDVHIGKLEERVSAIEIELAEWKGYVIGFGGLFSLLQALGLLKSFKGKDLTA